MVYNVPCKVRLYIREYGDRMTQVMKMAAAHVSDEVIQALDKLAAERGVERTKIIRWALIDYLKKHGTFVSTNEPDERQVETVV